jgi:uncharacterized membrane protein YagU involved in acid resistance
MQIPCLRPANDQRDNCTDERVEFSGSRGRMSIMGKLLIGAMAGITATTAMTMAMGALFRRLPADQRYPLPPRQVTESTLRQAGAAAALDEQTRADLALGNHFAFGAVAGAAYAEIEEKIPLPPVVKGVGYGVSVWAASYLGGFPLLGILRPATEHPRGRNALMIAAHVVWGGVTGIATQHLTAARDEILIDRDSHRATALRDAPRSTTVTDQHQ